MLSSPVGRGVTFSWPQEKQSSISVSNHVYESLQFGVDSISSIMKLYYQLYPVLLDIHFNMKLYFDH